MSPAARAELEAMFRSALAAVDPAEAVRRAVTLRDGELAIGGRPIPREAGLVVLAAGKAAAAMAAALEERAVDRIAAGLVVTRPEHGLPLRKLALREAGHPLPDTRSERAAREMLALADRARPQDVVVVLLSGGASALLTCPLPGLDLADLRQATSALLAAGVRIEALNCVRKHVLELAGGRLAGRIRAHRIEVLVVSDVLGDRLDVIGSGPCAPDPTSFADALAVVENAGLATRIPASVRAQLEAGARGEREETPKPGDPAFARVRTEILASNRMALEAARREAARRGVRAVVVTRALRGEARSAGRRLAALARGVAADGPVCLLAGGETTVTVRGAGRGGRNQELALAAALELESCPWVTLLAAGTDGTDGPTDAAGAFADGGTVARGRRLGLEAAVALERNDSHGFFVAEGGVFRTGPTRTNVMDLVLVRA